MMNRFSFLKFYYEPVRIAHNVPAVYDVLAARIRALRSKDQGWQNGGGVWCGNGAKRNDLASRNPEPPTGGEALTDLLCEVFGATNNDFFTTIL
jgi:hypothetical protein